MIDTNARKNFQKGFDELAKKSGLTRIHPNTITVAALVVGLLSAFFLAIGNTFVAVVLLWLSGLLDVLDGTVARLTGKTSPFGAYMDLVFDRMVEAAVIIACYIYMPQFALTYLLFFAGAMFNFSTFMLAGSLFKNTGKKSMYYDFGLVERTESFIFFSLIMMFPNFIVYTLNIFNLLMFITGIIRMHKIYKYTKHIQTLEG